jgi:very-short-patch-repair endonuclease
MMPRDSGNEPFASPPPERGRSASERSDASRVGVTPQSKFNRTKSKTARARQLRRDATDVEAILWRQLRAGRLAGLSFRRQHPAGPYTLDFYCPQLALVVELDGGQHSEEKHQARDKKRNEWLQARGITVLRFWNNDVTQNQPGVLERIKETADALRARGAGPALRWSADAKSDVDPHPTRFARRPPPFRGR